MGKVKVKIKGALAKAKKTLTKKGAYVPQVQLNVHLTYENGEKRK